MFEGFGLTREHPLMKLYYLVEFSFWLQQIVSLNVESKRKDYYQMFGHHILTCLLMYLSWHKNTVRVGHAILTLMDFSDILLPAAKLLKYARHQTLCDVGFVAFLVSWVATRHYLLTRIIWKIYAVQPLVIDGVNQTNIFVWLLSALELVICVWSAAIAKVLYGVVVGAGAQDNRSDSEDADVDLDLEDDLNDDFVSTGPGAAATTKFKAIHVVDRVPDDKEHLETPASAASSVDTPVSVPKKRQTNGHANGHDGGGGGGAHVNGYAKMNGKVNGNLH